MQRAQVTDGAKVRAFLTHDGQKGQVTFARQRDFAARKHPNAVGIQQQAYHHGRIERRCTPSFLLIRRIQAMYIQLGHGIQEEKTRSPQAAWRQGYAPPAESTAGPRDERFSHCAHSSSVSTCLRYEGRVSSSRYYRLMAPPRQHSHKRQADSFVDSLLGTSASGATTLTSWGMGGKCDWV